MPTSLDVPAKMLERLAAGPITETTAQLADTYGVSARTIKRAIHKLRAEGLARVVVTEHDGMSRESSRIVVLAGGAR